VTYTDVSICNLALSKLGEQTLTDLDGTDKATDLCNLYYNHVLNTVFSLHDWSEIIVRSDELSAEASAPNSGYSYQFTLPTDCLYVLEVVDWNYPYRIEAGKLLMDTEKCYIRYIKEEDTESAFSKAALLVEAIASRLAAVLAIPLAKGIQLKTLMDQDFAGALLLARQHDARYRQEEDSGSDLWVDALENDA
jgi:hypothetical protein